MPNGPRRIAGARRPVSRRRAATSRAHAVRAAGAAGLPGSTARPALALLVFPVRSDYYSWHTQFWAAPLRSPTHASLTSRYMSTHARPQIPPGTLQSLVRRGVASAAQLQQRERAASAVPAPPERWYGERLHDPHLVAMMPMMPSQLLGALRG